MNEHSFIRAIHRNLPPDIYRWKIYDPHTGGVPDAWYCTNGGKSLFVEYKYLRKIPSRLTTLMRADLSPLQLKWLLERQAQGVPVAVVLGAEDRGVLSSNVEDLVHGIAKESFVRQALSIKGLAGQIANRLATGNSSTHHTTGQGERYPAEESVDFAEERA